MSDSIIWLGIVAGFIVILGLCWYIWATSRELKVHRADQDQLLSDKKKQDKYLIDSLKVLATTILDDQVELSEGCIRIKVLLDHLDSNLHEHKSFKIFEEMYLATEHMPTHDARKNTDKHFTDKLDQQRFALEQKHREAIKSAAKALMEYLKS